MGILDYIVSSGPAGIHGSLCQNRDDDDDTYLWSFVYKMPGANRNLILSLFCVWHWQSSPGLGLCYYASTLPLHSTFPALSPLTCFSTFQMLTTSHLSPFLKEETQILTFKNLVARWLVAVLISNTLSIMLNWHCTTIVFEKDHLYIHPENCCHYARLAFDRSVS